MSFKDKFVGFLINALIAIGVTLVYIAIMTGVLALEALVVTKLWLLIPNIAFYPSFLQVFLSLYIIWILKIFLITGYDNK